MQQAVLEMLACAIAAAPFVIAYRFGGIGLENSSGLPHQAFVGIIPLGLSTLFLFGTKKEKAFALQRPSFIIALCAFLIWAALSLFWAHNTYEGARIWLQWITVLPLLFLITHITKAAREENLLRTALIASCAAVSFIGLIQHFGPHLLPFIPQRLPPASTFGHRNFAVQYVVLTLPIAAALWVGARRRHHYWFAAAALACSLAYLGNSGSRAAILALGIEAVCGAFLWRVSTFKKQSHTKPEKEKYLSGALALLLPLALLFAPAPPPAEEESLRERAATTLETLAHSGTLLQEDWDIAKHPMAANNMRTRIVLWRNSWKMFLDAPLAGVGLGNFKIQYPRYLRAGMDDRIFDASAQPSHPHNELIAITVETGLIGLILFLWLSLSFARAYLSTLKSIQDSDTRAFIWAIGTGLCGLAATAMVSFPLHKALPPFIIALYAGILVRHGAQTKQRASAWHIPAAYTTALSICIAIAAILSAYGQYRSISGEYWLARAREAARRKAWADTLAFSRLAIAYVPFRPRAAYPMGRAYFMEGRPEESVRVFKKLLQSYPHDINSHLGLGLAYQKLGYFDNAIRQFEKTLAITPTYAKAHNGIGLTHMQQKNFQQAAEAFQEAVRYDPENKTYRARLSAALALSGASPVSSGASERLR